MKFKSLACLSMALVLVSCGKNDSSSKPPVAENGLEKSINTQRLVSESDREYAAKLARVGEILVNNPIGVAHTNDLFEQALKLDPNNNKALLYSAFTGIAMTMEGYLRRTDKLSDAEDSSQSSYKFLKSLAEATKYPELINFLNGKASQSEIDTLNKLSNFYGTTVIESIEAGISKLNKIDGPVKVILSQLETETKVEYNCEKQVDIDGVVSTNCVQRESMNKVKALNAKTVSVDEKDVRAIIGGLKYHSAVGKLYTAYSLEGLELANKDIDSLVVNGSATNEQINAIYSKYPELFTLKSNNKLGQIRDNLADIVESAMDFIALEDEFCENDLRKENLLKSICSDSTDVGAIDWFTELLSGPTEYVLGMDANEEAVKVLVDLPAFLSNPVHDIKSLFASSYDENGEKVYTNNLTVNGLFPNGNLIEKQKQVVK